MSEANSDDVTDEPTESQSPTESPTRTRPTNDPAPGSDFELRTNLYRGALALFVLLAVVAVVQLYASVGATINTFISHKYRPLFRMAFNLVVLLVAGIGISWTVRELGGE